MQVTQLTCALFKFTWGLSSLILLSRFTNWTIWLTQCRPFHNKFTIFASYSINHFHYLCHLRTILSNFVGKIHILNYMVDTSNRPLSKSNCHLDCNQEIPQLMGTIKWIFSFSNVHSSSTKHENIVIQSFFFFSCGVVGLGGGIPKQITKCLGPCLWIIYALIELKFVTSIAENKIGIHAKYTKKKEWLWTNPTHC